jgi:FkbM family methyltransferase
MEEADVKVLACLPGFDAQVSQDVLDGKEYPVLARSFSFLKGLPVIDIGAHIGSAVVYFAATLDSPRIHAYEPNDQALEFLKANTQDIPGVEIFTEAVCAEDGLATLYSHEGGLFSASLKFSFGHPECKPVKTICAGKALRRIKGPIGILKIDTEGAEVDILEAAGDELSRVRVIYIEHHNEKLRKGIERLLDDQFSLFYSKIGLIMRLGDDAVSPQGVNGYVNRDFESQITSGNAH